MGTSESTGEQAPEEPEVWEVEPATDEPAAAAQPQRSSPALLALGYDLAEPSSVVELPRVLREVSAVCDVRDGRALCLQDERGVLFRVELSTGRVVQELPFGPDGDYEGLAPFDDGYVVLRSDGLLLVPSPEGAEPRPVVELAQSLPQREFESLCRDPVGGTWLLAPKDRARGEAADAAGLKKDDRPIYSLDVAAESPLPRRLAVVSRAGVVAGALADGVTLPREPVQADDDQEVEAGEGRVDVSLRFSDLAVHPLTGHLYLLSGPDRLLVVVDRAGGYLASHLLPRDLFPQPEGLAFAPDGELILTSEGAGRSAVLARYPYRPDE